MSCNPSNVPEQTQEELKILLHIQQERRKELLAEMEDSIQVLTTPPRNGKNFSQSDYERICKQLDLNGDIIMELQKRLKK